MVVFHVCGMRRSYSYTRGIVHHVGLPRKLRMAVNDHVTGLHLPLSLDARQRVLTRDYMGMGLLML